MAWPPDSCPTPRDRWAENDSCSTRHGAPYAWQLSTLCSWWDV
jgi:hypothetical protein